MSDDRAEILASAACGTTGWYVCEDNILVVAELIKRGWVRAQDDYETINVIATEKGIKYALRSQIIEKVDGGYGGEYGYGPKHPKRKNRPDQPKPIRAVNPCGRDRDGNRCCNLQQ